MSDLSGNRADFSTRTNTSDLIAIHQNALRGVEGFGSEGAEFDRLVDLEAAALLSLVTHEPEDAPAAVALCLYIASLAMTMRLAASGDSLAHAIVSMASALRHV